MGDKPSTVFTIEADPSRVADPRKFWKRVDVTKARDGSLQSTRRFASSTTPLERRMWIQIALESCLNAHTPFTVQPERVCVH